MSKPTRRAGDRKSTYQRGPHLYRRGEYWYARGGRLGRSGVALKTTERVEAERRFRALLAAPDGSGRTDAAPPPENDLTACALAWADAPHGYTRATRETQEGRVSAAVRWLRAQGIERPSGITDAVLDTWITARSSEVSRATINRDLRALRVCLRWCAARGLCAPVKPLGRDALREPKRETHKLLPDPAEVSRVLHLVTSQGYRDALTIYYATGLRYEELPRLTVGDLHDGRVWVRPEEGAADVAEPGKSYRTRAIPIAPEVRAVIVRFLAWRDGGLDPATGKHRRGRSAHKNALHRAIRLACEVTRVPRFGLHDLRRCFATEAVRRGVPLTVVRDWLGHQLTATTERYVGRYRSDAEVTAPLPAILMQTPVQTSGANVAELKPQDPTSGARVRGGHRG